MSRRSEGSRGEHPPWLQFSAAPQVPRSLTGTAGNLGSAMGWPWQSWACLRPWQTPSRVSPPTLTLQVVPSRAPSRLQAAPCTRSPWVASSAEKQPRSGGVQGPPTPSQAMRVSGKQLQAGLAWGSFWERGSRCEDAFRCRSQSSRASRLGAGCHSAPPFSGHAPSQLPVAGSPRSAQSPTCLPIPLQWATPPMEVSQAPLPWAPAWAFLTPSLHSMTVLKCIHKFFDIPPVTG